MPQFIKDMLIENNNSEFYNILGVEQFAEYITACLADMAIHVVCSVLIFILSYVLIRFLIYWLDLIARLPIICGLNQLAGAFLGLAQGFLILWIAGIVLKFFEAAPIGLILEQQIRASSWLSFLYQYNPLDFLFSGFYKRKFLIKAVYLVRCRIFTEAAYLIYSHNNIFNLNNSSVNSKFMLRSALFFKSLYIGICL